MTPAAVRIRRTLSAGGLALLLNCGVAKATLFEFSWHGDPARDATIVSSTDTSLRALGTIEIDAAPGATFTLGDVIATDIAVSGDSIADFVFTHWESVGGTISADGLTAHFTGEGNPFSAASRATFFGCRSPACEFNFAIDVTRTDPTIALAQVVYGSASAALAAFKIRAIRVAEPASTPLLLLACFIFAAATGRQCVHMRRRCTDDRTRHRTGRDKRRRDL